VGAKIVHSTLVINIGRQEEMWHGEGE